MGDRVAQAVLTQQPLVQPTSDRSVSRAKILSRRTSVEWIEQNGVWRATVGPWSAVVAQSEGGLWEWRAFSIDASECTRAVGGRGWTRRELAQEDAEATLSALG